jgi:hypothetical protein
MALGAFGATLLTAMAFAGVNPDNPNSWLPESVKDYLRTGRRSFYLYYILFAGFVIIIQGCYIYIEYGGDPNMLAAADTDYTVNYGIGLLVCLAVALAEHFVSEKVKAKNARGVFAVITILQIASIIAFFILL